MYGAELVAKRRFCALHAAAGAADHVRRDRYGVELRPQGGGFFTQGIVICDRCDPGVTGFAVQHAACNELLRFKICFHIRVLFFKVYTRRLCC